MATFEDILQKAQDSLKDTDSLMRETNLEGILNHVKKISKKTTAKNPLEITTISNYDMFILALVLSNFEDLSVFQNYKEDLEELADRINRWTFEANGKDLITLYDNMDNEGNLSHHKYLVNFTNLDIDLAAINYNLKVVCILMYRFLELKKDLIAGEKNYAKKSGYASVLSANRKFNPLITREEYLRKIYEANYTFTFLARAKEAIEKEEQLAKEKRRLIQARKKNTLEVIKQGQRIESLTSMPDDWHRYLDPEVLEELYFIIQGNLRKENETLKQEEEAILSQREKSPLTKFLYEKGYNPYSLDENLRKELESRPDIIASITLLLENQMTIEEIFTRYIPLLLSLSQEKIAKIKEIISKKALTPETFKKEISNIFGKKYQEIITNVSILELVIDFTNIFYDDCILLKSPQDIKNILGVLAHYTLTRNNYIFLLCHYEYIAIYDLLIEQEIPVELFISICKTENPLSTIKRIMIYKQINEPYETTSHRLKREVCSEERFGCLEEDLEAYIPNVVPIVNPHTITGATITNVVYHPLVKLLDQEFQLEDLYVIGDAIIARPKFLRNFEASEEQESTLISSLISSSILDDSAYYSLYNKLAEMKLQKK